MKRILYIIDNKVYLTAGLLLFLATFFSCNSDDITDESFYTFKDETVATFCENNPELSIFSRIVKESENFYLLSSYGHYTCFAPTNSAFDLYFKENGISYESLTAKDKQAIVYNHVIKGLNTDYVSLYFQGVLPENTMSDRYIGITYTVSEGSQKLFVNKQSQIIDKDNKLHNGVIHIVDRVVKPSDNYLDDVLREREEFSLFVEALELTKLNDSIQLVYDNSYTNPLPGGKKIEGFDCKYPDKKKYGYTLFAETNDVFRKAGITNIEQLIAEASKYYGRDDMNDYTSRKNPLNKFISYHILDRQMSTNSFVYSGKCTSANAEDKKYEYYETMLALRIIEIKSGNKINAHTVGGVETYVAVDELNSDYDGLNGFVHTLKNILVYDEDVMRNQVLNKRIRFDCFSVPPQLTNNNIRWQTVPGNNFTVTADYCAPHFKINEAANLRMIGSDYYTNYQGDEILINGWYDFTLRMIPVPPGHYEIRLGYRAETWRGIAQIFIDNEIVGIPVNLSKIGTDPDVGWINDDETRDNGIENDKMMRNLGYMKAPNSIYSLTGPKNLRQDSKSLRIILGKFSFQEYGYHYFRVKNVENESASYHFDYLEYVPVSILDQEGID